MVDVEAAIGFVVAKGDPVDRARLSYLRTGALPGDESYAAVEAEQTATGGWPASYSGTVPSVDATCFRLAHLDDLGGLRREPAQRALRWLAERQRPDGSWQEDEALAGDAPPWAKPGDPEATLYLTANAAFWLAIADRDTAAVHATDPSFAEPVTRAAELLRASLADDGSWPSYLVTGWLTAAVLFRQEMYYDAARVQMVLTDRAPDMSPSDVAWMAAALRRSGMADDDWTLQAAQKRLAETQRSDGGWTSDEGPAFDLNVTLHAIRACRN